MTSHRSHSGFCGHQVLYHTARALTVSISFTQIPRTSPFFLPRIWPWPTKSFPLVGCVCLYILRHISFLFSSLLFSIAPHAQTIKGHYRDCTKALLNSYIRSAQTCNKRPSRESQCQALTSRSATSMTASMPSRCLVRASHPTMYAFPPRSHSTPLPSTHTSI
jgi:hypothetical protein